MPGERGPIGLPGLPGPPGQNLDTNSSGGREVPGQRVGSLLLKLFDLIITNTKLSGSTRFVV